MKDENQPNGPSFFAEEAERLRRLNECKVKKKDSTSWIQKVSYYGLGVGVVGIGVLFIGVPLMAYNILSYSFVGMKLWNWFLVPGFDCKPVSMIYIAGLLLFIRLCTHTDSSLHSDESQDTVKNIARILGLMAAPWVIFLVGYIVNLFL